MSTTTLEERAQEQIERAVREAKARRVRVTVAFLAFIMLGASDAAFGVIIPGLRGHYHIDKATVSLLFLWSTAGYLIAAFTSGLLVQKLGRVAFLSLGAGIYGAGAGLFGLAPPFVALFAAMLVFGFGAGILDAGLNSFVASLPNNASTLNYLHAFYGTGALLGPLVASAGLALALPWNTPYFVWLVLAAIMLVGFQLLFRGVESAPQHVEERHEQGNVIAGALRLRIVQLAGLFLMISVGAEVSLGTWGYSFLTEQRGENPLLSGWLVSGYWFGLTVGRFILARVVERIGSRRTIQLCLVGVVVGMALVWAFPVGVAEAVGLWIAGFSVGPIFPTTIALLSERVPKRLLASAIGFAASMGAVGTAFFPWVEGNIAQWQGLWTLMPYVSALTVVMLGVWLVLSRAGARET